MAKGQPRKNDADKHTVISISIPNTLLNDIDQVLSKVSMGGNKSGFISHMIEIGFDVWNEQNSKRDI